MFGFGKSALEKAMIERMRTGLRQVGLEQYAENIVTQSKEETLKMVPDLSVMNWGDVLVQNPAYVDARKRFRLSEQDIRTYWNAGIFLRVTDNNMRNLVNVVKMEMLRNQEGLTVEQTFERHCKDCPIYGHLDAPHKLFRNGESNLPWELEERVYRWEMSTNPNEKAKLLQEHTSYNSMVEHLILEGDL